MSGLSDEFVEEEPDHPAVTFTEGMQGLTFTHVECQVIDEIIPVGLVLQEVVCRELLEDILSHPLNLIGAAEFLAL